MLYLLGMIWALASCQSGEKQQSFEGMVEYDSLVIRIDYPYLSDYTYLTPVYYRDTLYAAGANHFTESIDLVNLSGGNHREIITEREGQNGLLHISNFSLNGEHFIFTDAGKKIAVTDFNAKVIKRYEIADLEQEDKDVQYNHQQFNGTLGNGMHIETAGNETYIPLASLNTKPTSSIGAVLNLKNDTFTLLPIHYPEYLLADKDKMGGMAMADVMPYEDRLVISFPCSSRVYVYDRASGEQLTEFQMNSLFIDAEIEAPQGKRDAMKRIDFEYTSPRYRQTHYSPTLHKYYRMVWGKGDFNPNKRRPLYLMVYDEQTGNSREYELPESLSETYMVHDDVLYVRLRSKTDDFIKFAKIDIAKL